MQLHISRSMRSITISSSSNNGFIDLMKIKVAARHISYRTLFHTILILAFLLPFVFILTAVVTLEGVNKCSSFDCLGRRLGPRLLGRVDDSGRLVKDFYKILNQVKNEEIPDGVKLPASFSHLVSEMKNNQYDARTFAFMLRAMIELFYSTLVYSSIGAVMMEKLEREIRESKFAELMNKHFAASSIPKSIHCLSLRLTDEYSSNAHARKQLPSPEFLPLLSDNSYHHFVLSTDNILAASVVVTSTIQSSLKPDNIVFHIITDKKTYAGMHSWFALNPVSPAIVEVKGVHQFDWLTRENVPVLEAVENHNTIRNYYHGNHIAGTNLSDTTPRRFASKLQARSPNINLLRTNVSLVQLLRFARVFAILFCAGFIFSSSVGPISFLIGYVEQLFPNLDKVVFLDDDVVIQRDLSPLWEIDLKGKVNGAVETCKGEDEWNLKSNLTMWKLGTLPPALIAFKGHVHPIDPSWHMLGLGYQNKTNIESLKKAAVIHYNGQAKPWLEIGFEHLRPFWTKYVNYSNDFIRNCHILDSV
uniref:Hexosyltransferase n=1 Tax=Salix viminalis TaxID=40686 RepID=A0A6N2MFY3_SALVM